MTLGVVGVGPAAVVDEHGRIAPLGTARSFEWLVAGEDRWHRPVDDRTVEQRYVDQLAITETTVRVPRGEIVARSYAVPSSGGGAWVILEFENASASPAAIALAVHGTALVGTAQADLLTLDSQPALWWTRRPSRFVLVGAPTSAEEPARPGETALLDEQSWHDLSERVVERLVADDTEDLAPGVQVLRIADDGAFGCGFVWPLPHRATLRLAVPVGAVESSQPVLPPFDAVLRGWSRQVEALARIDLPDARFGAAWTAAVRSLLVHVGAEALEPPIGSEDHWTVGDEAIAVRGLAVAGAAGDAARTLVLRLDAHLEHNWIDRAGRPTRVDPATAGAVLDALADTVLLADDPTLAEASLGPAMAFVRPLETLVDPGPRATLDRLGGALVRLGVGTLDRRRSRAASGNDVHPAVDDTDALAVALRRVRDLGGRMVWPGPGTGDDPTGAARTLLALRGLLVHEPLLSGPHAVVELLPDVPPDWYGRPVEIHDLPTAYGRVSFAVRWHGERPALLWQFDAWTSTPSPVTLRCPGLDADWSTTEPRGEALLTRPPLAEERLAPAAAPTTAAPTTAAPAPSGDPDGTGLSFS
jgi:hypothetical protein